MTSPDEDVFQWAVDERKHYNATIAAGRTPQQPLIPLRNIDIKLDGPSGGRPLHDAAFAFSETITAVRIIGLSTRDLGSLLVDFSVGQGASLSCWNTPNLS